MDIKNYYFLLELSIDPPENTPEVIEDAIQKKQALWSRLRNHPTKGTQAQQYMGLLPDIRNVMTNDALRRKEAEEAKRLFIEREKETNNRIDRHIALLLSKGRISGDEISQLARLNSVSEERIQERITKKKRLFLINFKIEELVRTGKTDPKYHGGLVKEFSLDPGKISDWIQNKEREKYKKIDACLRRCNQRGYVTREEISALSRLFLISTDNIVRRTRCVIKESGTPMQDRPEPLDKSTEKIIADNLKIVGKSSLYDFLDVPQGSDLNVLQDTTHGKDAEVRKIGQKDAKTTASGTLVGHCISIFKTEENRRSYDRSLTLSRLQELDADMDVSGISKKIHAEYLSILMKSALKLGMDIDEARLHIEGYLRKKRWKIEKLKPFIAKRRPFFLRPVTIAIAVLLALSTASALVILRKKQVAREFSETLKLAELSQELENKEMILRGFLEKYPDSDLAPDLEKKIAAVRGLVENRDYKIVLTQFEKFVRDDTLIEAAAVLNKHMEKYPKGPHRKEMEEKRAQIRRSLEDSNYEALQAALTVCEERKEWEKCILLCDHFIYKNSDSRHSEKASGLKKKYARIIQSIADLASMKQRAEQQGIDFEAGRLIYLEYLESTPELPLIIKKAIVDEIESYDRKIVMFHQAENEWGRLMDASDNDHISLSDHIRQLKAFIQKYPREWYGEEADYLLTRLEKQNTLKTRQLRTEKENHDWKALALDAQNQRLSLSSRMSKVEGFIQNYPDGNYITKAKILFVSLNKQQKLEESKLLQEKSDASRRQEKMHQLSGMLKNLGGFFIDNNNGTVTDKRTGLMWSIFHASLAGNSCVNHREALQYVNRLGTAGYRDWRVPSVEELQVILQTRPLFPADRSTFFWTSELFWHGWNEMAFIFSPHNNTEWKKESGRVEKCGSVLAVRNP
ncbi:DUF1566 domain-containing protein [Desulfococcus sp.]|uniref:Lcl C-terminal domain-containing protein n=1 Tax=Desulfococcus sp. TaxID=2025834 RepID=UPI0035935116